MDLRGLPFPNLVRVSPSMLRLHNGRRRNPQQRRPNFNDRNNLNFNANNKPDSHSPNNKYIDDEDGNRDRDNEGKQEERGQDEKNQREDAWTVLGGKVYNITPYLPYHPGGEAELMRAAGRDATTLFMEVHAWVSWESMLRNCLIGVYVSEEDDPHDDDDDDDRDDHANDVEHTRDNAEGTKGVNRGNQSKQGKEIARDDDYSLESSTEMEIRNDDRSSRKSRSRIGAQDGNEKRELDWEEMD